MVLPGGTGTLLELAFVWGRLNKGLPQGKALLILLRDHWVPLLEPIRREQPDALAPKLATTVPEVIACVREELHRARV